MAAITSKAGPLREQALAKLYEAKDILDSGGDLNAADNRRFQAAMREFRKFDAEAAAAMGLPSHAAGAASETEDNVGTLRERMEHYSGKGTSFPMPFPGRGGTSSGGLPGRSGLPAASWADAVLNAHGGPLTYGAALVPSGSVPVAIPLRSEPVSDPRQAQFVADLIPSPVGGGAPSGIYSYFRQTVRTLNAAVVAKGEKKPTSTISGETVQDRTRVIAHLSEPINRIDLSDAPLLRQFLDDELRYGLRLALDAEILSGDGTGEHFLGFLQAGIETQTFDTDVLVTTRKAITQLEQRDLAATAFVFTPATWESIELVAADQFASNPNRRSPVDSMERRLWGVPVVVSNSLPAATGLLGDFRGSSALYLTGDARVDWSEAVYDPDRFGPGDGGTGFEANQVQFRAEMRANVAVLRTFGFVEINFGS